MNASETAHAFTALLKSGQHVEAGDQFNAEDIVSYEAMGPMQVCKGRAAVKAKGDWWYANHEIHSATTTGPYVNGDQFVVEFEMDVTMKTTSQRIQMREIGLYTVRDGKIAEERFFYVEG